jgi:hypothetical protein
MNIHPEQWPYNVLDVSSAWEGLENYIIPIIKNFNINPKTAIEFGVDHGYSSYVFSKVFDKVIGVDSFEGDCHIIHEQGDSFYNTVKSRFADTNVEIIRSRFEEFINNNNNKYDLIHIDIVHLYDPTYKCAEWSVDHSNVVILHDTCSFPDINKVCCDIAENKNINYYNIPVCHGLGILYR